MKTKERILKQQKELNKIWDREFEKNGNSIKSVWNVRIAEKTGRKDGKTKTV